MIDNYKVITNLESLYMIYHRTKGETQEAISRFIHDNNNVVVALGLDRSDDAWVCNILDSEGNTVHVMTTQKQTAIDYFTADYDMDQDDHYVAPFEYAQRNDGVFGVVRLDNNTTMWFERRYVGTWVRE